MHRCLRRTALFFLPLAVIALSPPRPCGAQLKDAATVETASESRFAPATTQRFRVGAIVTAKNGPCRDIFAMVAVPLVCEGQAARIVEEDITPNVTEHTFRELKGGGATQLLLRIPRLSANEEARAVVTFEVQTNPILPPEDSLAASLRIPKRPPRGLRRYLGPSPYIESGNPKIKRLARDVLQEFEEAAAASDPPDDWRRVEALYTHVLDTIEYAEGPDTSALTTLRDGFADCHGRTALFVALCRASGVPARVVWVQDHCYPEFYLEDGSGAGLWLPAESAGTRAFGEMPIARTILQKGDNFRIPERPRDRLRYASDYLVGRPVPGGGKPRVKYIREVVGDAASP